MNGATEEPRNHNNPPNINKIIKTGAIQYFFLLNINLNISIIKLISRTYNILIYSQLINCRIYFKTFSRLC